MGILREKYTKEYFTGMDNSGNSVCYGVTKEVDETGILILREFDRRILDMINLNNKSVLDIGCGRGEAVCYAIMNGAANCVGIDFSNYAIDLTKSLIHQRRLEEPELLCIDILDYINMINTKEPKFDVIIMLDVIEHIPRSEVKKIFDKLPTIMSQNGILVINTPAYNFDNDVIQDGYDERNIDGCLDTSDVIPETKGMHCNKYSIISLQEFMHECGFVNITEAHYYLPVQNNGEFEKLSILPYSVRWNKAINLNIPLKGIYSDDLVEYPYSTTPDLQYRTFSEGNLKGITLLLTNEYKEEAFPFGNYDTEMLFAFDKDKKNNMVIFDVGGFIGVSSLLFAKYGGGNSKIYCFEPNPFNANRIFKNLSHNQCFAEQIFIYQNALGEKNGTIAMTLSSEIDNGYSSTSRIQNSHPKIEDDSLPKGFFSQIIEERTLDWFVETNHIVPDIIKIDVEGAEHYVLSGALNTILQYKPELLIEYHSEFCSMMCSVFLTRLGYSQLLIKEEADNRITIRAVHENNRSEYQENNEDFFKSHIINQEKITQFFDEEYVNKLQSDQKRLYQLESDINTLNEIKNSKILHIINKIRKLIIN